MQIETIQIPLGTQFFSSRKEALKTLKAAIEKAIQETVGDAYKAKVEADERPWQVNVSLTLEVA